MPDKVGHVLDQEEPWPKDGDVFGEHRENTIVAIATVVVTVTQLAEALAGRTCGDQFDVADAPTVGLYESASFLAQEVGGSCDLLTEVVVVGRDGLVPRVVSLRDLEPERPEADPDSAETSAEFHGGAAGCPRCDVALRS